MKVPCFVDGWGFEEGCPQNRVVFEGVVPERGVFWARVEVLMRRAWRWRGVKKYESWLLGRDSMWDCLLCGWRLWGFLGHFGVGSFDRRGSEEFLFADCGYEFLEVEWFEVGDVFKAALAVGAEGRLEHC